MVKGLKSKLNRLMKRRAILDAQIAEVRAQIAECVRSDDVEIARLVIEHGMAPEKVALDTRASIYRVRRVVREAKYDIAQQELEAEQKEDMMRRDAERTITIKITAQRKIGIGGTTCSPGEVVRVTPHEAGDILWQGLAMLATQADLALFKDAFPNVTGDVPVAEDGEAL